MAHLNRVPLAVGKLYTPQTGRILKGYYGFKFNEILHWHAGCIRVVRGDRSLHDVHCLW